MDNQEDNSLLDLILGALGDFFTDTGNRDFGQQPYWPAPSHEELWKSYVPELNAANYGNAVAVQQAVINAALAGMANNQVSAYLPTADEVIRQYIDTTYGNDGVITPEEAYQIGREAEAAGVTPEQIAEATGVPVEEVASYYPKELSPIDLGQTYSEQSNIQPSDTVSSSGASTVPHVTNAIANAIATGGNGAIDSFAIASPFAAAKIFYDFVKDFKLFHSKKDYPSFDELPLEQQAEIIYDQFLSKVASGGQGLGGEDTEGAAAFTPETAQAVYDFIANLNLSDVEGLLTDIRNTQEPGTVDDPIPEGYVRDSQGFLRDIATEGYWLLSNGKPIPTTPPLIPVPMPSTGGAATSGATTSVRDITDDIWTYEGEGVFSNAILGERRDIKDFPDYELPSDIEVGQDYTVDPTGNIVPVYRVDTEHPWRYEDGVMTNVITGETVTVPEGKRELYKNGGMYSKAGWDFDDIGPVDWWDIYNTKGVPGILDILTTTGKTVQDIATDTGVPVSVIQDIIDKASTNTDTGTCTGLNEEAGPLGSCVCKQGFTRDASGKCVATGTSSDSRCSDPVFALLSPQICGSKYGTAAYGGQKISVEQAPIADIPYLYDITTGTYIPTRPTNNTNTVKKVAKGGKIGEPDLVDELITLFETRR